MGVSPAFGGVGRGGDFFRGDSSGGGGEGRGRDAKGRVRRGRGGGSEVKASGGGGGVFGTEVFRRSVGGR